MTWVIGASSLFDYGVKCPWCAAEVDLGPTGEDLSDTRYKLTCPVLLVHLAARRHDRP
jgi:hypothetical protein